MTVFDQITDSPQAVRELIQRLSRRLREADECNVNDERQSGRTAGIREAADRQAAVESYLAAKNPWLQRQLYAPLGLSDLPFVVGRGACCTGRAAGFAARSQTR